MKTEQLIVILSMCSCSIAIAQNRDCGTMEALKHQQQQDTSLTKKMDSLEVIKQQFLKESGRYENYSNLDLPVIPGFTPTGDPETDLKNFAIAKKELYAKNPELYKELTRKESKTQNKRK
ncbi:MAG: hypothetical protein O3B47_05550 [bacterium]|nr:hypothetical protein [bacterium]